MTDFDYKKYSLENLEKWMEDAVTSGDASPEEIYDTIRKVVEENYYHHKHHVSRCYELLALLNGNGKDHLSCDKDDKSPECQKAWNDFWEENYYPEESKVDGYSVDGKDHSEYWYEYDRNDPNRSNPFKVNKWILPVELDGLTGDCYIQLPDDLLELANLKEGDQVEWIPQENGSYIMKKLDAHS